ncbi:hypothetical protein Tco_1351894 [Tanacetum coccineum]
MLDKQQTQKDKHGIGFTKDIASTSNTKIKKSGLVDKEMSTVEPALLVPSARELASSIEQNRLSTENAETLESNIVRLKVKLEPDEWIKDSGCSRHMTGNKHLFSSYKAIDGGVETIVYADSDHAGDYVDRKSTSGVCTFMGCCLTSRFSKKQTALAISTTEAEYVSARKAYQQALWMKQALVDYDIVLDDIPVLCDNKGSIDLSKNPVLHSRTEHIDICHHFLRDNVQKGNVSIEKVSSEDNIVDILTKPLK